MRRAAFAGVLWAGCTVSNPGYQPGEDAAVRPPELAIRAEAGSPDLGQGETLRSDGPRQDRTLLPDTRRQFDVKPFPDTTPWQCQNSSDCDDKLACTADTCSQKKCVNTIQTGCVIFGACFAEDATNPLNPCERCIPGVDTTSWTVAGEGAPCPGDGLSCTLDLCRSGVCKHELDDNDCLIQGVCHAEGANNPANSCQACYPTVTQNAWTPKKDGAFCSGDGLSCTVDACKAGVCTHDVSSQSCLVGGQCYSNGQSAWNNPCQECVAAVSNTALTFVTGKPCTPASTPGALAGMCYKTKCAPWVETILDLPVPGPNPVQSSALNAVDHVPASGNVWTAGEYTTGLGSGGMLLQLGSIIPAIPVITANRFRGLKHRLAVGDAGIAMAYEPVTGWTHQAKIEGYLAGLYRSGVWGAPIANGGERFFLTGTQGASQTGVVSCTVGTDTVCVDHTGVKNGAQLGPIFGALGPTGGLAAVWALPLSSVTDIYFHAGTGASWSVAAPTGCEDYGNSSSTPCSQTSGSWRDLHASGPSDAWAVGGNGLLMRWDGTKWTRFSNVISSQSSYTMTAVYGSPADGLVTFAATSTFNGRWVYLFNYNQTLARWLGPIVLVNPSGTNSQDELRDLGGQGYGALFGVGVRQVDPATGTPRNLAWTVQLKP